MDTSRLPHEEFDQNKVHYFIDLLRRGVLLPPVVYTPTAQPLTGTHRILAHQALGIAIPALVITDQDFKKLLSMFASQFRLDLFKNNRTRIFINELLAKITKDPVLKHVLFDQGLHFQFQISDYFQEGSRGLIIEEELRSALLKTFNASFELIDEILVDKTQLSGNLEKEEFDDPWTENYYKGENG